MKRFVALFAGAALASSLIAPIVSSSPAGADNASDAMAFVGAINAVRGQHGVAPLAVDVRLNNLAVWWSGQMSGAGLSHNPNLAGMLPAGWTKGGENVGVGPNEPSLEAAFENSAEHLANMVDPAFTTIGVGVVMSGNTMWVTEDYAAGVQAITPAPPAPPASGPLSFLRNSLTSGTSDLNFAYGMAGDVTLSCNWTGTGVDTPAVFRNGMWYVRLSNTTGVGEVAFAYGSPGDIPVCGDWAGIGHDTPGVYRNGRFYLRNSLSGGDADVAFDYGAPTDTPVVGQWTGGNRTTIGVYRRSDATFYLRNSDSAGVGDEVIPFGNPGDVPVVGRWTTGRTTTIGVFRPSTGTFYLSADNTFGSWVTSMSYGGPGDHPTAGDWIGQGHDTVGIVR
jgi:hypothetical protein